MRDVAERVLAYETREGQPAESAIAVILKVCEKLRSHLSVLMGNAGFRALLQRALALARAEAPWLRAVLVGADGRLNGFDALESQVDSARIAEGGTILLAQLLGLLAAFIGENLTLGIVREVWPKLSVDDLNSGD